MVPTENEEAIEKAISDYKKVQPAQMAILENEGANGKPAPIPETPAGAKSGADFIRVTVDKLERITALSEELQVTKLETEDHFTLSISSEGSQIFICLEPEKEVFRTNLCFC